MKQKVEKKKVLKEEKKAEPKITRKSKFQEKYKKVVTNNLSSEKAGIALSYKDWPGKTQIVIPLNDIKGGLSTVDTSVISDKQVVQSMQGEDDKGVESRKEMVDIKEREAIEVELFESYLIFAQIFGIAEKVAKELGLGVGISSGANLIASILLKGNKKKIVTVFADDNKKYLSTDLSKEIVDNNEYISNQIKLIDYTII